MRIHIFPERKLFPPFNACIYCGDSSGALSDEHIIPYALDGRLELPRAVCASCQKITWWPENECLGKTFSAARAKANIRTRRPKARPIEFAVGVYDGVSSELPMNLGDSNFRWKNLPLEIHPAPIFLPTWPRPGLLTGIEYPDDGLTIVAMQVHNFDFLESNQGTTSQVAMVPFRADALARMLAKIAHGLAIAELGRSAFESYLIPYILRDRSDYNRVIGSTSMGRIIRNKTCFTSLHLEQGFVVAHIQLFARHMKIVFEIVVGKSNQDCGWSIQYSIPRV